MEIRGFEPLTYGLQSRRSSQLSYIPLLQTIVIKKGVGKKREISGSFVYNLQSSYFDIYLSLRKEVIQPHLPVRLPCYDFTLLTKRTFGTVLLCRLDERLRVPPTRMV